ncbi:hypothetical protein [uncultured Aliiroseovarius sp.]|uniref:hypothetical protein n=1 Tax=uncultured Aliiroseovarius sp. TaxID=1658783 RepID=UPI0026169649|nr:hypothetical protein [uncultured Aliiroseovarius sp.]
MPSEINVIGLENWYKLLFLGISSVSALLTAAVVIIWLRPKQLTMIIDRNRYYRWLVFLIASLLPASLFIGLSYLAMAIWYLSVEIIVFNETNSSLFAGVMKSTDYVLRALKFIFVGLVLFITSASAPLFLPSAKPSPSDEEQSVAKK